MSQMDRRRALSLLAGLGAAGITAACGSDPETDGTTAPLSDIPVKIGLITPQTGNFKSIGEEITHGFELYLDMHGRRLGGHPVVLNTADEGDTEKSGKDAMEQVLGKGVDAVTGVVSSAVMLAVKDMIRSAKVPLVGSNASPVALQGDVFIWRTSFVNDEVGEAMGGYLAGRKDSGRVAMVAVDSPAGRDAIEGFRRAFNARERLIDQPILTGTSDVPSRTELATAMSAIAAARADSAFCFFAGPAAAQFVRAFRAAKLTTKLYGAGFLTEGRVLDDLDNDARGILTALNYSADLSNAANRTFAAAYRRAHGVSPTTYAMASYDAAQVLDRAIVLAGENPSALEINRLLGKVGQVDSPRGPWQFNQSRTPQQKWYLREVRQDGPVLSNVLITELSTLG